MAEILSLGECQNALRRFGAQDVGSIDEFYEGAAKGARSSLPLIPHLGFLSGTDQRFEAFLVACRNLDRLVESGEISRDEAPFSLLLMTLSDKNFQRATIAFVQHAKYRFNGAMTAYSETANSYFQWL